MKFEFKTKKSAGVRVTRTVHRLISAGNEARDAGDWRGAADAYRSALGAAPDLHHIRIQFGHALRQSGQLDAADLAYAEAARLRPDDIEPIRFRAYLAKDEGRLSDALGLFGKALDSAHRDEAVAEINRMIEPATPFPAEALAEMLREAAIGTAASYRDDVERLLVFDITDLVGHFRSQRLPNGIERVQMEVLRATLDARGADAVGICCFVSAREQWIGVKASRFREAARLAVAGRDTADRDWQRARGQLLLELMIAEPFAMPDRAVLINTGTSWRIDDAFRFVRNAKERSGIRYIPFVHDLIPIVASEHCLPGITEDFTSWLIGAIRHADGFLVNSHATRRDLLRVADTLGFPLPAGRIEVVPLDADFRRVSEPLPVAALATWQLADVPFALLVSTIESRKNHILALDAWAELIRLHGADAIPRLVCVGRDGWLNDPVFARLIADPMLKAHVTIIHQVSDAELALLYRGCRFTVYPSLYEGWGLPVTEALSYGRIPVVADNSSLPEAGGRFALIFESNSIPALVRAVEQVLFDDRWREERERTIADEFSPRSWAQLAAQIGDAATAFSALDPAAPMPPVAPNLYHPVSLQKRRRVWKCLASGEIFRVGDGWLWPETSGCRIAPQGGELRMLIAGASRLCLHLEGLTNDDCSVSITIDGKAVGETLLPAGGRRWIVHEVQAGNLSILIAGDKAETVSLSIAGTEKSCHAGVKVLGFLLDDGCEPSVRGVLRDDVGVDELERIGAYRETLSSLRLSAE